MEVSAGCNVVESVSEVADPQQGTLAFVTGDSKLYVYVDSQWTAVSGSGG